MRHRKNTVKFGRQTSHYKATLKHLAIGLVKNKSIVTTKVKAKEASRVADKLVTLAKKDTVTSRRRAYSILQDRTLVGILFNDIGPLFKDRQGGYTRVILLGRRKGDNAETALLEFVEKPKVEPKPKKEKKAKKEKETIKEEKQDQAESNIEEKPENKVEPKKKAIEEKPVKKEPVKKKYTERHKELDSKPGFFKKIFGRKQDK
ncbi:MAG: 50S ribosomal protein L17 [Candidatus Omnitrophota bacterium]